MAAANYVKACELLGVTLASKPADTERWLLPRPDTPARALPLAAVTA